MNNQVMLDLETMGNTSCSAIIAIGAVAFNESGIFSKFYKQVSLESSVNNGGVIDTSTLLWWLQQSNDARKAFENNDKADHINVALTEFAHWFCENDCVEVWGNGVAFDNVILNNAYEKAKFKTPWSFWNDRCYRTLKSLNEEIKIERVGTHHNAVDDAESQALHLLKILSTQECSK